MPINKTELSEELKKIFKWIPKGVRADKIDYGGIIRDVIAWHEKELNKAISEAKKADRERIVLAFLRASINVISVMYSDFYGIDIHPNDEAERRQQLLHSFETFCEGADQIDNFDLEEIGDFLGIIKKLSQSK